MTCISLASKNKMKSKLPIRIYISCNQLPRTQQSIARIVARLGDSCIRTNPIILVHSEDWEFNQNFQDLDVTFENTNKTADAYEFPALRRMWLDSQKDDFFGLYLHAKGASKTETHQWNNACAWQDYMLQAVVDRADLCLDHLSAGAELVGSQWHWHWKGNFYWFDSRYIRQLVDPYAMDQTYRNNCEHWVSYSYWWGRYSLPRIKNLFYLPLMSDNHYYSLADCGYKPNWQESKNFDGSVQQLIDNGWYGAYNKMTFSDNDIHTNLQTIVKYLNYDSVVTNRDTGEQWSANKLMRML